MEFEAQPSHARHASGKRIDPHDTAYVIFATGSLGSIPSAVGIAGIDFTGIVVADTLSSALYCSAYLSPPTGYFVPSKAGYYFNMGETYTDQHIVQTDQWEVAMMGMETKLHFQRSRDRLFMTCPVMFAGVPFIGEGYLLNLSLVGCTVECERSVLDGSYMRLRLLLPDHMPSIDVDLAAVRWVRGQFFGVEFLRLPAQERSRLDRFLSDHRV